MEEIGTTNLSTSHCRLYGTCSCTYPQKTIPLAPIHPFTKQIRSTFMVSRIIAPKIIGIVFSSSSYVPYTVVLSINNIFTHFIFLLSLFLSFSSHIFVGLCEPRKFSSICTFTCLSNNSLIS